MFTVGVKQHNNNNNFPFGVWIKLWVLIRTVAEVSLLLYFFYKTKTPISDLDLASDAIVTAYEVLCVDSHALLYCISN